MDVLALVLVPAAAAGLVAVAVTVAIERLGGVVGGLLGTLPTTIVPASIGIWLAQPDPDSFGAAMGAVPAGMLLNAGFLWLWRFLPPRLPAVGLGARLSLMVLITLVAWGGLAAVAVGAMASSRWLGLGVGVAILALHVAIGVAACWHQVPAPRGTQRVGVGVLVARSGLAGAAIAVSTLLARSGDDLLAGVASVFPAIFLTTMVALWISQDEAVPSGAVGPMMLGGASVGAYALLAAVLVPQVGLVAASILAWFGAVVAVTVPAWTWLRRRHDALV